MDKRKALRMIRCAYKRVQNEINTRASSGGFYGRGLSSEGYDGGYAQALSDVEALLTHGSPSNRTHFWEDHDE